VNPNRPLTREMLEELQKGHPSALIELVMRMRRLWRRCARKWGACDAGWRSCRGGEHKE
jgi:hypothetical protein